MNADLYSPPVAEPVPAASIDRRRGRTLAVTGVVFLLGPAVGLVALVISMSSAFAVLAKDGQADPEVLASSISAAMIGTMVAWGLGLIGVGLCSVSLFGQGNRERWFQVSVIILSVISMGLFPVGTVLGLVLLVAVILRWREFRIEGAIGTAPKTPIS